ncbi:MAG: putative ABC transporter permease [Clostridia bacterium]|nr:putative ABC transporter permease [Clostridia bacterium]
MSLFLVLAFLFFIGSVGGWIAELLFRRFFSNANPERKWINPGLCTGPYLPLYGSGLCILFLLASLENKSFITNPALNKATLFLFMAIAMTAIEYVAGLFCLKITHVRLWDYRNEKWNVQGIICPKFSLIWAILGALYYFLIHNKVLHALYWLSQNLAFSFVIGFFFGVFLLDLIHATQFLVRLRKFAGENDIILRYEALKVQLRQRHERNKEKYSFLLPFRSARPLNEYIKEMRDAYETRKRK